MHGRTVADGTSVRPAETCWHMVFTLYNGETHPLLVGPLPTAGIASWGSEAEILWIQFKLGTFMPGIPTRTLIDQETRLSAAGSRSFWLDGSIWELPSFENADTFVDRLVRREILVRDRMVDEILCGQPQGNSPRTIRHRFLRATGLTRGYIRQVEQAHRAAEMLRQGKPIVEAALEAGYYDQPHMTRALKRLVGLTPGEILRVSQPAAIAV
jgi:AraC-like DNA-binding protein